MREQIANPYPVVRRASAAQPVLPASPHRAGHYAGVHPEDQPYYSTQVRSRAGRPAPTTIDDVSGEDGDYQQPVRMRTSARRYQHLPMTPHQQLPPPEPERKRVHWLVFVGLAMFIMIVGWLVFNALGSWIHDREDDLTYGYPRTYQTDANVGHNGRVSHFLCLNLHGEIEVIETQPGHPEASKVYVIMVLPADQDRVPVTISFQDINGDGKLDGLVHLGATEIPLYNNGVTFQSQPPAPAK
jgi:hypothetical protein